MQCCGCQGEESQHSAPILSSVWGWSETPTALLDSWFCFLNGDLKGKIISVKASQATCVSLL